jgi:prephenate dehydrogenase
LKQITIIGTGLIGGSFALALKARRLADRIVGCDRAPVLEQATRQGTIDHGEPDPQRACAQSDVVLLATPVGAIIDLIERLGPILPKDVLLTDVGSTKSDIAARARDVFGAEAAQRFLPGHPMAGKEHGGIEHASADLFAGATWIFTAGVDVARDAKAYAFLETIRAIGAQPLFMDAAEHDRMCAWVSHLPQFVSTAMASALLEEFGATPELHAIGARALREMTRIAASPYSMWRDIAITNAANIDAALSRFEQKLAHLRENLRAPALRDEFEKANLFSPEKRSAKPQDTKETK